MQSLPSPSAPSRIAMLRRFRTLYIVLTVIFAGITIGIIAWHWNQSKPYALGFPYHWSVPILLIASFLVNGIAFFFQDRYTRKLLQRPNIAHQFRVFPFALRFYLYSFATAAVLSITCFFPLLALFFFYWTYPIALWLIPYQAIVGATLGWDILRQLRS